MRIAVVTPYHTTQTDALKKCMESVKRQTHPECIHVLVGDGCHHEGLAVSDSLHKVTLSHNIGDYGDSPRSLGAIYAFAQGADGVAFLDSDNWYEANHIESLVALQSQTGASVLTSYRKLARLDGSLMGVCPHSNSLSFCDTNCMLFMRDAGAVATSWWTIPQALHPIDDRVIWDRVLTEQHPIACTQEATVVYRTGFQHHYYMFKEKPPPGSKVGEDIGQLRETMIQLGNKATRMAPSLMCR